MLRDTYPTQVSKVPITYTKQTQNGAQFDIGKGTLNKFRIRPQILNEHCESSREILDVVDSTTVVGQFFKTSKNNINSISLTLESAAGSVIDNFESYADNAALRAEWVLTGTSEAILETVIVNDGTKSMKLPGTIVDDEWINTIVAVDYTNYNFNIKWYQDKEYNKLKYEFFIGDGTNTKSFALTVNTINTWLDFSIDINAMSEDGGGTTDVTAVTKIGIRLADKEATYAGYIDNIIAVPPPGDVDIELWNFGDTLPTGNGTEDYTSIGTQYTELGDRGIGGTVQSTIRLTLVGGKRKYQIDNFIAGVALEHPSNTLLTVNNYYALVLKYVDTDVNVYGADTTFSTNYYTNGYAWKAETGDDLIDKIQGAAGSGAYSDLMFQIYSTQDAYVLSVCMVADSSPNGNAGASIFIEDSNMIVTDIIAVYQQGGLGRTQLDFDLKTSPNFMETGGKLEAYYDDDFTDSVSQILFIFDYLYIPPTVNG